VHRVLSQALNYAARQDLIPYNPASREKVTPPRPKWVKTSFLDEKQVMKLLDEAAGSRYHDFIYLALWTGMRRNEILALRWQDIDLNQGTVFVNASIHQVEGRLMRRATKTQRSCRTISISTSACDLLRQRKGQLIAQGLVPRDSDYVFSRADGQPYHPDAVTHDFAKIVKSAGLLNIRLHDLRHAHASFLIKQGIPAKVISERLGHSGISITMDTYGHLMPGMDGLTAQKFDEVFGR
jgi:integrase